MRLDQCPRCWSGPIDSDTHTEEACDRIRRDFAHLGLPPEDAPAPWRKGWTCRPEQYRSVPLSWLLDVLDQCDIPELPGDGRTRESRAHRRAIDLVRQAVRRGP